MEEYLCQCTLYIHTHTNAKTQAVGTVNVVGLMFVLAAQNDEWTELNKQTHESELIIYSTYVPNHNVTRFFLLLFSFVICIFFVVAWLVVVLTTINCFTQRNNRQSAKKPSDFRKYIEIWQSCELYTQFAYWIYFHGMTNCFEFDVSIWFCCSFLVIRQRYTMPTNDSNHQRHRYCYHHYDNDDQDVQWKQHQHF